MKSREAREGRFGRLGSTPKRRADMMYGLAKLDRLLEEIGGKIRALGHTDPQPVDLRGGQRLRVLQPLDDIGGLAEVVLMRGKAASGFSVGEIEREVVGDQRQRTRAGRGDSEEITVIRIFTSYGELASVRKLTHQADMGG